MTDLPRPPQGDVVLGSRYRLERLLGRGGMADVYEAEDQQLRRKVAIKRFRGITAGDRARFDAEVRLVASLDHPGLVAVFDAGVDGEGAYVVLELVDGPSLAARLAADGPLPAGEVAILGADVAAALAHVHRAGVVHRDVTPSNLLCGPDGRARLTDFGIARSVGATRVTVPGSAIGTAAYLAPEQVRGAEVTPAADVYALGLVLLEALTGRRGFDGAPSEAAVARLARQPDTASGVPVEWRDLLARMTARVPEDRPATAGVQAELARLADPPRPIAGRPPVWERTQVLPVPVSPAPAARTAPPMGRRAVVAVAAAIVVGAVLLALTDDTDFGSVPASPVTEPDAAPVATTGLPPTTVAPAAAERKTEPPADTEELPPGKAKRRDGDEDKGDD